MSESTPATILVVDDEPQIRRLLRISLVAHGFLVEEAAGVADALRLYAARSPDLVLLDLDLGQGLGDGGGIEVLDHVRQTSSVPVIVLTVRDREADKILLLEAGADDYVTKPFSTGELVARIRAALRKQARQTDGAPVHHHDGLSVDLGLRTVQIDGQDIHLTRKEYAVLAFLARHAGRVVTHGQLLEEVWGRVHRDDVQYLRVTIQQLRAKLGDSADRQRFIRTEQGVGYRLRIG